MVYHRNGLNEVENLIEEQVSEIVREMYAKDPTLSIHGVIRPIAYAYINKEISNKILTDNKFLNAAKVTYEDLVEFIKGSPALEVLDVDVDVVEVESLEKKRFENGRRKHNPHQDLHILYYANSKAGTSFNEDGLIAHLERQNIEFLKPTLRNTLSRFCKDKRFLTKNEAVSKTYNIEEAGKLELKILATRYGWPSE